MLPRNWWKNPPLKIPPREEVCWTSDCRTGIDGMAIFGADEPLAGVLSLFEVGSFAVDSLDDPTPRKRLKADLNPPLEFWSWPFWAMAELTQLIAMARLQINRGNGKADWHGVDSIIRLNKSAAKLERR